MKDFRLNLIDQATGLISSTDATFINGYDGTANPFQISDRWLWTFVTSDEYSEWSYVGSTGNVLPGLGFTLKGTNGTNNTDIDGTYGAEVLNPGDNQSYEFRGKPNNGTITNAVAAEQLTLVGNPYPSAMDSAAYVHDTQNQNAITGTLYYWEQDTSVNSHVLQDYIGGYSAFTIDATGLIISNSPATFFTYDEDDNIFALPPPGASGSKQALRYIPIGQGFMVEGSLTTTGSVRTTNSMRAFEKESDGESYFFRLADGNAENLVSGIQYQDNGLPIVPEDYKRFRINVDFSVNTNRYTRQLLLNFHETATNGFDYGLELHMSNKLNSDAYFSFENELFSGLAYNYNEALRIPLVIDAEFPQPLRFRVFDIQNFDDNQGIYVYDKHNNVYANLRSQDYEINIEEGNFTDRFEIVFVEEDPLSLGEQGISTLSIFQNNPETKLTVFNPSGLELKQLELYDITGKLILVNSLGFEQEYALSTNALSEGVYLAKINLNNGSTFSEKIIIKN